MTPTYLEVTEDQYNNGSSDICSCGAKNYFLESLANVTYKWTCAKCKEENLHPWVKMHKKRIDDLIEKSNLLIIDRCRS
jgi:hypothetical protein